MANQKNNIQQIPLNGTLNMNTLKTEVKQFEGFNEKNSTVFGGTLSPFYSKETELFPANKSYSFYNSKGVPYTLQYDSDSIGLYKNNEKVASSNVVSNSGFIPNVPDTALSAILYHGGAIYIDKNSEGNWCVYDHNTEKYTFNIGELVAVKICPIVEISGVLILALSDSQIQTIFINKGGPEKIFTVEPLYHGLYIAGSTPVISGNLYSKTYRFSIFRNAKVKIDSGESVNFNVNFTLASSNAVNEIELENVTQSSGIFNIYPDRLASSVKLHRVLFTDGLKSLVVTQFGWRYVYSSDDKNFVYNSSVNDDVNQLRYCGVVNNYLPCDINSVGPNNDTDIEVYYNSEGGLEGISSYGIPIEPYLGFGITQITTYFENGYLYIAYQRDDGKWCYFCTVGTTSSSTSRGYPHTGIKDLLIDSRYVILRSTSNGCNIYDIETDTLVNRNFGWMLCDPPYSYRKPYRETTEGDTHFGYYNVSVSKKLNLLLLLPYLSVSITKISGDNTLTKVEYKPKEGEITDIPKENGAFSKAIYDYDGGEIILTSEKEGKTTTIAFGTSYTVNENISIEGNTVTSTEKIDERIGSAYAAGYNAGFENNNEKFIGFIANPYVVQNSPSLNIIYPEVPENVQYYADYSNTELSPKYVGTDTKYEGTLYPIDANANILLPYSLSATIIKGYSNNDFIKAGSKAYPLIYWNTNQRIFSYYIQSMVENMENAFSLQGQQYTVDNENIYAVAYADGTIQNIQPVCYKKNMIFIGALPTQAVFWSKFNKSFYSFTGDRVLSKMSEASVINEIKYFSLNPATQSIWVCTNDGTYIFSDSDVYRLDDISDEIAFTDNTAILTVKKENEDGVLCFYKHEISLYDLNNDAEMVPVKLKTAYYGTGNEHKSVMDCWYIRLFDENKTEGDIKVKVNTITDVSRQTEEKTIHIGLNDYDENGIAYVRYQPKYQDCVAMQLELESPIGIYELAIGVNPTEATAQISKINF